MAPVTISVAGVTRQIIDDSTLTVLLDRLSTFDTSADQSISPYDEADTDNVDIDGIVSELEKYPKWRFQEQVNIFF